MTSLLIRSIENGVLRLVLDHNESRNSLSEAMMAQLRQALAEAAGDSAVRVIVIAANGPVFSSGHNLKEITLHRSDGDKGGLWFNGLLQSCSELMLAIVNSPKPMIAEVQGLASAAGCQLVASCDLAIASSAASFCMPGVNIGVFCSTPMVALSRKVAPKHAMEMLLTGEVFAATEALRIGLINRVVAPDELRHATSALANRIASKSAMTLRIGKNAFNEQLGLPLDEAYAVAARVMTENLLRQDAVEGIAAVLGKREPQWSDS